MKNVQQLNSTFSSIEQYLAPVDVHDSERALFGGILTAMVAVLVLLAECWIVYHAVEQQINVTFAVICHAIVVTLLLIYAELASVIGQEKRFAILLALSTAAAGPYGAGGMIIGTILFYFFSRTSHPFEEWYRSMFPRFKMTGSERIYDDLKVGRDESEKIYSVIPFLDVMAFGREQEKRRALAKMTSAFHPSFAPVFKKALSDPSNTIRVQAATAITKIEHQFTMKQMQLAAVEQQYPNDPVVLLALAKHYDAYAYTGILDANREVQNRAHALKYYKQYLESSPDDVGVCADVGRVLMRGHQYPEAVEWFRRCIDKGQVTPAMSHWYAEALFATGRFAELRQYSRQLPAVAQEHASFQPALKQAVELWVTNGVSA